MMLTRIDAGIKRQSTYRGTDLMQTLADVCARHNLAQPVDILPGTQQRLDDVEKPGQQDGFLYLFNDGLGGFIQNHRNADRGETFFFGGIGLRLNDTQKRELRKQREIHKRRRAEEAARAAEAVVRLWNQAEPAPTDHPYLVRKGISSAAGMLRMLRQFPVGAPRSLLTLQAPVLMVPIVDIYGNPMTAEYIGADGDKRYHTGGAREGGVITVMRGDWSAGVVYVAEGFSTAVTIADATGRPCVCAFDAGNLPKVTAAIRQQWPAVGMIVAGDDDVRLERAGKANKGLVKAIEATATGRALTYIIPDFSALQERGEWSDFNDMAELLGHEAVRYRLDPANMPSRSSPDWIRNDSLEELRAGNFGEAELGRMFARLRQDDMRYVDVWKTWLRYDGGVWEREKTGRGLDLIGQMCEEVVARGQERLAKNCNLRASRTRKAVDEIARVDRRIAATDEQWDRHPWLLNTPGGVVDLQTGVLMPHRPDLYLTDQTSVTPKGECSNFLRFLHDVCCDDAELVAYLQRLLGYCLTGITREQVLAFFHGSGRNGKGTLLDTVKHILQGYYKATDSQTFMESHQDRHRSELAVLRNARLVTASEISQGKTWNDKRIKELTGQDTITANYMRCDPFTFVPQFKIVIMSNNKPRLSNVDPAIKARLQMVPFFRNFEKEGIQDKNMRQKLETEAAGILAWMVEGCLAWQRHGLQPPQVVRATTEAYLAAEDLEAQWMHDCCDLDDTAVTSLDVLFASWVQYADKRHGRTKRDRDLAERLQRDGFYQQQLTDGVAFKGIRLKKLDAGRFIGNVVPIHGS